MGEEGADGETELGTPTATLERLALESANLNPVVDHERANDALKSFSNCTRLVVAAIIFLVLEMGLVQVGLAELNDIERIKSEVGMGGATPILTFVADWSTLLDYTPPVMYLFALFAGMWHARHLAQAMGADLSPSNSSRFG